MIPKRFDCQKCDKYTHCTSLCSAAKRYVNQDVKRKHRKEISKGLVIPNKSTEENTLTKEENIVMLYFSYKWNQTEIADKMYVSRQFVSKVVKRYKDIISRNLRK